LESISDDSVRRIAQLSAEHRRTHEELSAIACDVLEESGAYTITDGRQLPTGFSGRQRRRVPGVLYSVPRPNGKRTWVYRPDEADPERPGLKYEATCKKLGGPGNVLYVHPSQRRLIGDRRAPVIFVEGVKKALAIISAVRAAGVEVLVVGVLGVWNWLSDGKPIGDLLGIPVHGRDLYICYDSDVFINPDVADAARGFVGHLTDRGGAVWVAYLPDQVDGSKMGADDYLASGRTYWELMALMRPYDAADLAAERLKRGDRLRAMLEDLIENFWASEWKGMRGHSSRDVFKVFMDLAPDRGKLHPDGLRVKVSWGELATMAKVSTRTLQKAIERLEEMELIYRDNAGRRPRQCGAFVLRATVKHYGEGSRQRGATGDGETGATLGTLHLRAPRLRWSSPARKERRGVVKGTRRVRLSPAPNPRPAVKRPGKIRGAAVDALDAAGGWDTVENVCRILHRSRPRDLVRFKVSDKGHDGPLVMLLEAGIVEWVSDVQTRREILRLTPNWLERLEEARQVAGESDFEVLSGRLADDGRPSVVRRKGAATLQRERQERKSRAWRLREEDPPGAHWANVPDADGHVEELRPADELERPEAEEAPVSPLAAAVRAYLERNPRDADQPSGWIGRTLWAYDLHPGKPGPGEVRAAIEELGGDIYLRERLRVAKGVAA
jgi:hypothetical protein